MHENLLEIYKRRRSVYNLGRGITLSDTEISVLVGDCVKNAPSAFNSQSARVVILFGNEHQELWNIVLRHLQKLTPADKFTATRNKIASFAAAYGTVLFFEDQAVVKKMQEDFPLYKDAFPLYSCQSSGMLQYMVWTAFSAAEVGASLQHYNPLIDDDVRQRWQLPDSWRLFSQMPFGSIEQAAGSKEFLPLEERMKIFS